MAKKSTTKVVEEVEDDDEVELEELDADVDDDEDEAPKAKSKKSKTEKKARADEPQFGIQWLIRLIKKKTDKDYTPREVRTLLRKMAREDKPRINREIIPGNRARYEWSGPEDAEVKAVLKAVGGGEIEAGKKEALDRLKQQKAAKDAKAETTTKKKKKKAALPPPDEDDDDEDDE